MLGALLAVSLVLHDGPAVEWPRQRAVPVASEKPGVDAQPRRFQPVWWDGKPPCVYLR